LDVRAVRTGDGLWGRIGLGIVAAAAILGIWAATAGFLQPSCG
jgi:hypothetical protein